MRTFWPYVDDDILLAEIKLVMKTMLDTTKDIDIHRNVLDPFSAIFDMAIQNIDFTDWIEQEQLRQAQKTLQNAVGYFHQHLLGAVDGWRDTGDGGGYDLINEDLRIIAELKNKHNTMNANSAVQVYTKMTRHLDGDRHGYQGYVVTIIPKRPVRFTVPYAPSDSGRLPERTDLLKTDGATFYEIVTGDRDALKKLYSCLPRAIEAVFKDIEIDIDSSQEFQRLFSRSFGN